MMMAPVILSGVKDLSGRDPSPSARLRMTGLAFGVITLLALALFARPLFRGEVLTFRDHADYFQPLHYFTADELRHFHLPLWNPYNASGEPWLANPQTGVFYPPAWIFLVLPFATAYVLFLLFHMALLGCGAFLLFSRVGSLRSALIGAVILMLCGPTLSMIDISNNLTTFAWLPLVLWCAMSNTSTMLSAMAIAMSFLAGEPFFAAAGALMFVLIRRKNIIDIAITAFCLSAIQLIPFLAMIAGSDRAGSTPREEILRDSMTFADWLRIVVPGGVTHQHFIPSVYIGIVPTVLALLGIWDRRARGWLILLAASVILSAGSGELLARLPLTIIRYPARVVPLGAFAIAALAVIGCDRLPRAGKSTFASLLVLLVIVELVPRVGPLLQSAPFDPSVPYARVVGRDGKIARVMPPNLSTIDRRAWIAGYLNLFEHRFDAWTAAPVVSASYTRAYIGAMSNRNLLDRASIAYIVTLENGRVGIVHNPTAFPMAYWRDSAGRIARASLLACTTSSVFVSIDAPADGVVVVTQQLASGWSVEVDGARANAERDGVFRAVGVRRGRHAITWRYRPRSLAIGIALTMLAIFRMLLSTKFVKRFGTKNIFSRKQNSLEV
jgi:hypothetical protein